MEIIMDARPKIRKIFHITRMSFALIVVSSLLSACLQVAGHVAYMKSKKQHTATVHFQKSPDTVYNALLRIAEKEPGLEIISKSDDEMIVEAKKGDRYFFAQVFPAEGGLSQLVLSVDAGEVNLEMKAAPVKANPGTGLVVSVVPHDSGQTGEELAMRSVRRICNELEVKCRVSAGK